MATHYHRVPPGPRGIPLLGMGWRWRRDLLQMLTALANEYGDVVLLKLPVGNRILLNHPSDIERVLVLEQNKFQKSTFTRRATERLLGNGLLTSEGQLWRRQRRLAQPVFQRQRVAEYARTMVELTLAHIETWHEGQELDLAEEMMKLTQTIALKTLFGSELKSEAARVGEALGIVMRYQLNRLRSPLRLPEKWPTRSSRRAQGAYDFLDSIVYRIIAERLADPKLGDDLLSRLLHALDEDGSKMSPKQLRDEIMTIFLAGHETTALTLSWSWFLLTENARTELCLQEELRRVLGGRDPAADDLERLPYLDAVIRESMRLYPPAYIITRTSVEPFDIAGYNFHAGTTVLMSQWVMHRSGKYFEKPLTFLPERWLDGLADRLPPYAYFPFGGGPRRCIGQAFAQMEAALLVATIAQRFRFLLVPGHLVVPEPLVTLRVKYGMRVTVHPQS
jgi:cytochrome P450